METVSQQMEAKLKSIDIYEGSNVLKPEVRTRTVDIIDRIETKFLTGEGEVKDLPSQFLERAIATLTEAQEGLSDVFLNPGRYIDESKFVPQSQENAAEVLEKRALKEKELENLVEEFAGILETFIEKLRSALAKKKGGGEPPEKPPEKSVTAEYDEDGFKKQILKDTGNPNFFKQLDDLSSILDSGTVKASYPRERKGENNIWNNEKEKLLARMNADYTLVGELLRQISEIETDLASVTDTIGAAKKGFIRREIRKILDPLESQIKIKRDALQLELETDVVRGWERNPKGRQLFSIQESLIQRVEKNVGFANLAEAQKLEQDLETEYKAYQNNLTISIQTLTELNPPAGTVDRIKMELRARYEDSRTAIMAELHRQVLENWKNQYLEIVVFKTIRGIESSRLGTLAEYKSNYDKRSTEINRLEGEKASVLAKLPNDPVIRSDAEAHFDSKIAEMKVKQNALVEGQYSQWKDVDIQSAISGAEKARKTASTAAASAKTVAEVDVALSGLNTADASLDISSSSALSELIDSAKKTLAKNMIDSEKEKNQEQRDKLNIKRGELVTEQARISAEATVESKKQLFQQAVTDIRKYKVELDDKTQDEKAKISDLQPLLDALDKAGDDLDGTGVRIENDPGYQAAREKIDGLMERAKIREMTLEQVINIISSGTNKIDTLFDKGFSRYTDPKQRSLVLRFQSLYYQQADTASFLVARRPDGTVDALETEKNRIEHRRQKARVWAYKYDDDYSSGKGHPAADNENIFVKMNQWGISKDDIHRGVFEHPEWGVVATEMLRYGKNFVADEEPSKDPADGGKFASKLKLSYGDLGDDGASDRLRAHFEKIFKGSGANRMPAEHFDIVWNLYKVFDLPSLSLTKMQKRGKTRSHNFKKTIINVATNHAADVTYLQRPLERGQHMFHRGGNEKDARLNLRVLTGRQPKDIWPPGTPQAGKYVWQGSEDQVDGKDVLTIDEIQDLLILYHETFFNLTGIENSVLPTGSSLQDWEEAQFPDFFDFLTSRDVVNPTTGERKNDVQTWELYCTAMEGWESMLSMTVGEIKGTGEHGSLTYDDIFNAEKGLYSQFINKGLSAAKMTKGQHWKWFVPMTRLFVARCAAKFSSEEPSDRRNLQTQFANQFRRTGDAGLDFESFDMGLHSEFQTFIRELEDGSTAPPPLWARERVHENFRLQHGKFRREERIDFARRWYELKTGKTPPGVADELIGAGRLYRGNDKMIILFYAIIDETVRLEDFKQYIEIADRTQTSTSDSQGKGGK